MNIDDTIYITLIILSIPLGLLFKNSKSPKFKTIWSSLIGFIIALIVCYKDILHSLFIVTINSLLIQFMHPKYLPIFSFITTFGYLLFFRTTEYFGLPKPVPYANAIQLILTLKIVGLAFEVHDTYKRKVSLKNLDVNKIDQNEVNNLKLQIECSLIKKKPTWYDVFAYSYCYIGILTGPYFKYRTYKDWIEMKYGNKIDILSIIIKRGRTLPFIIIGFLVLSTFVSFKDAANEEFYENTLQYRLIYMILIFYLFRFRFYIAWIFAEISCMTAAFAAYPISSKAKPGAGPTDLEEYNKFDSSKPNEFNFTAIYNIDEFGCEMAPTVKQVLHHWNMTIQYWMATNIYKRVPIKSIGQPCTMFISAYWHGIHPGYYLSFLTTTPCIMAENLMEKGLKSRLNPRYHKFYDVCTWVFRTREFDYMSIGFILLRFDLTIKYWKSVYFIGHLTSFFFIVLGYILIRLKKSKKD